MFDWLGNAWDDFTSLFGSDESKDLTDWDSKYNPPTYDFKGEQGAYDVFKNDYETDGVLQGDYSSFQPPRNYDDNQGGGILKSLLSPSVLGAAITSGAGLLGGLNQMDMQKQALKAQEEQKKMNQLLEMAKLKYQLLGKGASGGGRRSGGANPSVGINQQASAQLASGYQNLGGNLASIYK
jgi:hypothetical protein